MENELRIAGIQANLFWEDALSNRKQFDEKIEQLPKNIDLIVLPEMFASGFSMEAQKVAEQPYGETVLWMQNTAKTKAIAICGSLAIEENNMYYNRFLFVHPSGKIELYNKRHPFSLSGEDKIFTSGKEKKIIEYKGWKICPQICYDLRFPVWSRNTNNYDLLIYVANWPKKRVNAWQTLLKARAIENMAYTIGVNRIGTDQNNLDYTGKSMIVDFLGKSLATLKPNVEGIVFTTLSKKKQNDARKKLGFLNDRDHFNII
ncbi:amidohydrolase [Polaribacter sp.]|nr:amidohydrolase [Polaribacter sp.]